MNKYCGLFLSCCMLVGITACSEGEKDIPEGIELTTLEQKASYLFGYSIARQAAEAGMTLDEDVFRMAVNDVSSGAEARLSDEEFRSVSATFQSLQREGANAKARAAQIELGRTFLDANAKRPEITRTASGLQYEVLSSGDGKQPELNSTVIVHYHGTLLDGKVFDSSRENGEPVSFPVQGVIPGWTEVLQLMSEGDMWKVYIPYNLAYPNGTRSIPPGSTLAFEIELIEVLTP